MSIIVDPVGMSIIVDPVGNDIIPVGTLVEIHGLQSEAGKKLNGGQGIILKEPEMVQGKLRYPLRVYAVLSACGTTLKAKMGDIDDTTNNKSINSDNLTILNNQKQDNFKTVATATITSFIDEYSGKCPSKENCKKVAIWFDSFCRIWPNGCDGDYTILLQCTDVYHAILEDSEKALKVMLPIVDTFPSSHPQYVVVLRQFACICSYAQSHLEKALEKAKLIPTDTAENQEHAVMAFTAIAKGAGKINHQDPKKEKNPGMLDLQVQAAHSLYNIKPDITSLWYLGAAYCVKGDNFLGAKYYRQALKQELESPGQIISSERSRLEFDLMCAQLQCPGMPCENYILLGKQDDHILYIHEDDKDKCVLMAFDHSVDLSNDKNTQILHVPPGENVEKIKFPLPDGHDDRNVFPQSFLDTLNEP